jgi:hypothetical protein
MIGATNFMADPEMIRPPFSQEKNEWMFNWAARGFTGKLSAQVIDEGPLAAQLSSTWTKPVALRDYCLR